MVCLSNEEGSGDSCPYCYSWFLIAGRSLGKYGLVPYPAIQFDITVRENIDSVRLHFQGRGSSNEHWQVTEAFLPLLVFSITLAIVKAISALIAK